MAQFDVRRTSTDSRIDALLLKLENPQRFLQEEAGLLVSELQATAPVDKGTLKSGLNYVRLYQNGSWSWGVGIGNPDILTNWRRKPPPGTIGDFVDWLRVQNEGYLGENQTRVGHRIGIRTSHQATGANRRRESVSARAAWHTEQVKKSGAFTRKSYESQFGKSYRQKISAIRKQTKADEKARKKLLREQVKAEKAKVKFETKVAKSVESRVKKYLKNPTAQNRSFLQRAYDAAAKKIKRSQVNDAVTRSIRNLYPDVTRTWTTPKSFSRFEGQRGRETITNTFQSENFKSATAHVFRTIYYRKKK